MAFAKKRNIIFLGLTSFLLLLGAGVAFAQDSNQTLQQGVAVIFSYSLTIAIVLSAIVVGFGAIYYMVSLGKGNMNDEGKEWIKAGITGLLITLLSWLVLYTINPGLFTFDLKQLPAIILSIGKSITGGSSTNPNMVYYNEIPVGTLTENLLTNKMDCYDFDVEGNPIPGSVTTDDNKKQFLPPSNMNHDRLDCYLKLSDAAEKKAQAVEDLSKEITKLMDTCSCAQYGNCQDTNNNQQNCLNTKTPQSAEDCNVYSGACKLPDGFVNSNVGLEPDNSLACCPDGVKLQIKGYLNAHGDGRAAKIKPISVQMTDVCSNGNCIDSVVQNFYGLDEFYTTKGDIIGLVEKTTQVNKKDVTYIDLGNCGACTNVCDPNSKDYQTCVQTQDTCLNNRQQCLTQTPWGKLNLVEQLTYLQEKINQIRDAIQKDSDSVTQASQQMQSCPLVKSYADFISTDASVDKNTVTLAVNQGSVSTQNYCNGFNYTNSEAYQQCSNACPITKDSLSCYSKCNSTVCDPKSKNYQQCLTNKSTCTTACYGNQSCPYAPQFPTFNYCVSNYQSTCQATCSAKYLPCSDEYKNCQANCSSNSQCVLGNLNSCVLNTSALANCNNANFTDSQKQQCINSSYTCAAGSQQNAGYPECLSNTQAKDFSASYIYQNQQQQICPNPGSTIYTGSGGTTTCELTNPQTAKCPASSQCPSCSCTSINQTLTYSLEPKVSPQEINSCATPPLSLGDFPTTDFPPPEESCDTVTKKITGYQVVGAQCEQPAFNGDPLTFYCRQDWWDEPVAQRNQNIGTSSDPKKNIECSALDEIPVGETVDDSVKVAGDILDKAHPIVDSIESLIDFMKAKVGDAREYCACDSKYDPSNDPVCQSCCQYPADGGSCQYQACSGNSCQQMINWLQQIINLHRDIKSDYINLNAYLIIDPRSDVLKELTYSRNEMTRASSIQDEVGSDNLKILSCQQALDDVLYPITDASHKIIIDQKQISHYCYGAMVGQIFNNSAKTDNWFACETTEQTQQTLPSPLEYVPVS